ncbi:adenosine kinase 2 [Brevipalpus obovatus]|uniref:adenosine kinase 2 n=1 Tax=Brevipalpus obovatus TaxID=246614 RepID=UPI003D9E5298
MTSDLKEGVVFGLGNPLLDLLADVDDEFLAKYDLKANDAILAGDKHKDLDKVLQEKYDVKYIAGGSVQNTMRIAEWMLDFKPNICTYMGCIGKDALGDRMKEEASKDKILSAYLIDEKEKTGYCAVLITDGGKKRSLVAFLGAANNMKDDHLLANWKLVEQAKFFYVSGFHIMVCPSAVMKLAEHAAQSPDKIFSFNLSAAFIMKVYGSLVEKVMPYVDILFGNEEEATTYSELKGWETRDLKSICGQIVEDMKKTSTKERIVIITQGHNPVLVGSTSSSEQIKEYPVKQLAKEEIVDTNGAGDAFAAGFISQFIQKKSLDECIAAASYAAQAIIKQSGAYYPSYPAKIN